MNCTQTAITAGTFEQQWGLDATGNWKTFKQDNDGNSTWELNQTRNTNKANEITAITNSVGAAWATPTYDPAGNMTRIPNPSSLTAQYDAWNRLVSISDGANTVSQHVYDARGHRIRKDTYTSGTLSETRHYDDTPGWQCVEERTGTLTTLERQFVWGLRYIDDLVLRDRSTANNGVINERRYAMQDGNWNTVAICDITGFVSERFAYSAYGTPVFMTGVGVVQASSPIGFETLYAGYRWDGTTPQMYYVRNRFLLPMIGTWNRRDPLGYVDGMSLYRAYSTINSVDPFGREDLELGPQPWDEARRRRKRATSSKESQIINKTLQYSCRCGWIDWGHAGGKGKDPSQGYEEFKKIWEQVKAIGSSKERGGRGTVCYGVSQKKGVLTTGVRICFYVHSGLSEDEIRCAAWGIFRKVQETFEKHQANIPVVNSSGQSPEDLPSDLILFQRVVSGGALTVEKGVCRCHVPRGRRHGKMGGIEMRR